MSNYKIGVNLRVTENSNQGGRKYMEDNHAIRFVKNDEGGFEFAYFGIFDGHGGGEASKFAREHLLDEITKYDCFWSENDNDVLEAIKFGFLDTHYAMWREVETWPRTWNGMQSTSGTTCSIAIIKNSKLYIGHVGDSGIALGYDESKSESFIRPRGTMLTVDHKPDCPIEKKRIEESGGQVVAKSGVQRVVWNRPKTSHRGPIRRSTPIDRIPFLAVARSLGDLWSYNYLNEQFVVSPEPDVSVHKLDPSKDKCLIFGSDGLWNMVSAEEAVSMVVDLEYQFEYKVVHDPQATVSYWINPAEKLVNRALNKWRARLMKADNTSCVVVLIDPLGPRKLSILKKKREEHFRKMKEEKMKLTDSVKCAPRTSPRKSHEDKTDNPITTSMKKVTSPSKDKHKNVHSDASVDNKPAVSPVSPEKSKSNSLPVNLGGDLDDSIQVVSANKKLTFTPSLDKKEDIPYDFINSLCTAHNMPTVDVSPTKKAVMNTTNSSESKSLVLTKNSPKKLSPCTRTRQRHSSHPSSAPTSSPSKEKRTHTTLKPVDKRAQSLPVLTDNSQKQQQNNNRQPVANVDIKASRNIFDSCHMDLRVKTSTECSKGQPFRQNSEKIQHKSIHTAQNQQVKRIIGHKGVKSSIIPRTSLRLKRGLQKALRSSVQAENKHFLTRTRVSGVKRKATSHAADIMPLSKKLCRS